MAATFNHIGIVVPDVADGVDIVEIMEPRNELSTAYDAL